MVEEAFGQSGGPVGISEQLRPHEPSGEAGARRRPADAEASSERFLNRGFDERRLARSRRPGDDAATEIHVPDV